MGETTPPPPVRAAAAAAAAAVAALECQVPVSSADATEASLQKAWLSALEA
jgi:hypothetical protein